MPLLKRADDGPWEKFSCLNSLREVEGSSNLVLVDLPEAASAIPIEEEETAE